MSSSTVPPSPAALPPIPPNIGELIGPQLIGSLFNFGLLGILVVQGYVYRLSFPNDNTKIKALVYFVIIFETAVTIMSGVAAYDWFASGFGNLLVISDPGFSPVTTPIMGSIMALIVQSFFCYRIFIIKRTAWWISASIFFVSLLQAAAGIGGGIRSLMFVGSTSESHSNNQTILVYLWLAGSAVADLMIALAMTIFLLKAHIGNQTNDFVARIVRLTIETNAVTAAVAVVSLILFAGIPSSPAFIAPTMILGKLYANTLLLTFNNRAFMMAKFSSSMGSGSGNSRLKPTVGSGSGINPPSMPFHAGLNPDTTQASFTLDSFDDRKNQISMTTYTSTVVDTPRKDASFGV